MIRRYAVLDSDGVKINTITADEELINTGWYPGYGAMLVDEGEDPPDPPPPPPPTKPQTWQVIAMLKEPMLSGDRLDLKTMEVIKAVPVIAPILAEEPIADGG